MQYEVTLPPKPSAHTFPSVNSFSRLRKQLRPRTFPLQQPMSRLILNLLANLLIFRGQRRTYLIQFLLETNIPSINYMEKQPDQLSHLQKRQWISLLSKPRTKSNKHHLSKVQSCFLQMETRMIPKLMRIKLQLRKNLDTRRKRYQRNKRSSRLKELLLFRKQTLLNRWREKPTLLLII